MPTSPLKTESIMLMAIRLHRLIKLGEETVPSCSHDWILREIADLAVGRLQCEPLADPFMWRRLNHKMTRTLDTVKIHEHFAFIYSGQDKARSFALERALPAPPRSR